DRVDARAAAAAPAGLKPLGCGVKLLRHRTGCGAALVVRPRRPADPPKEEADDERGAGIAYDAAAHGDGTRCGGRPSSRSSRGSAWDRDAVPESAKDALTGGCPDARAGGAGRSASASAVVPAATT